MTACHDPYRELEHYLEKAREEIGRAIKELEEHDDETIDDWQNYPGDLLPPPQAFRSQNWNAEPNETKSSSDANTTSSLNRFCHDGNIHDLGYYSSPKSSVSCTNNGSFVSSFGNGISAKSVHAGCSPSTRRRLWSMHPSISFPETSKDLLLIGKDTLCNTQTPIIQPSVTYRQRSNSDSLSPKPEGSFPRPPSGDVNLLSIWADNLVLELDKSLSGELLNEQFSPSSDFSLSPIKHDEQPPQSFLSPKDASSRSPDSGIEQNSCHTPDMLEDCVDSAKSPDASPSQVRSKDRSQGTQTQGCFRRRDGSCVKSAELVCETLETLTDANHQESLLPQAQSIPLKSLEQLEDSPVVRTVCAVNEVSVVRGERTGCYRQPLLTNSVEYPMFSSLPKPPKIVPNDIDLLPKNGYNTNTFPQRCPSQLGVSSRNYVSIDELAALMRQVKSTPLHPPSCADMSTDVKDENKDAGTQTTPIPLSRSSSLTWVTDCDCSEWDVQNGGSDCSKESDTKEAATSSSSSLDASSDDEDCCAGSGSSSSSLYLSACSGSSDSFEEATVVSPPRSSEVTLRPLDDISEVTSEDLEDEPASFPSTLKTPRRPLEPTVLVINELNHKSVSAPVLLRQKSLVPKALSSSSSSDSSPPTGTRSKELSADSKQVPARSYSAKELNELQAIEACSWLRAAGFPQYAQMYEDNQFPIDICMVQKDHAFLHPDSIQSLFRRLNTLNRCAKMKFMDHVHRKSVPLEDSDEEEQYALSENWEFQRSSRRWSRIPSPSAEIEFVTGDPPPVPKPTVQLTLAPNNRKYLSPEEAYSSSHDSVFVDDHHSSSDSIRRVVQKSERIYSGLLGDCSPGSSSGSGGTLSLASDDMPERRSLRRSGSDRVKEGAKALLRRMESLKGKRKKKDAAGKSEKVPPSQNGTDGSSSSSLASSPQFPRPHKKKDAQLDTESGVQNDESGVHCDSECRLFLVSRDWKSANGNTKLPFSGSKTSVTVTSPQDEQLPSALKEKRNLTPDAQRTNLLHPTNCQKEESKRGSYYDNVSAPLVVFNDLFTESISTASSKAASKSESLNSDQDSYQNQEDGDIIILTNDRRDSGVGSSLTRGITCYQTPWHCFPLHVSSNSKPLQNPVQISDLTASQILLLRKLSLLKLTTVMEKFSPSSRTWWSSGVSKFIGRIRNPDYKDKVVFGVPLLINLQRTGHPLPVSIQAAINHLKKTALDSTGLFRKSGVRSRIQKLKTLNEVSPDTINYEEHQSYDVADMLKQYFRELPEALLTNKLSETFISIFQHVPEDLRLETIKAALMLMPDENREVLQSLLEFLQEICQHSSVNQMTATNLAVCFAPSLFHLSTPRSASSSPRRRKTVGAPDLRELNENRAAYECLSCMITNFKTLFSVSEEVISQSRISNSHFQPATLEELASIYSQPNGWRGFIDNCVQTLLKEAKEKYKGWKTISQNDHIELSYKKLSDEHLLKLWKVSTEVEAPPVDILNRILRERHVWDSTFTKWKVVSRMNKHSEIYQYLNTSSPPHPPSDYCILRSWRTDLPKGTCVLVETSIENREAEAIPGSVRALVLASQYLIEPCGSGKSRITYISRVDTRGRSPEWYNRAYGHICILFLMKLRNSFLHTRADGPETKV